MSELSNLERAVLEGIAKQYPHLAAAFRSQLGSVVVTKRENSGAGMFADLALTDPAVLLFDTNAPLGDVYSTIGGKRLCFLVHLEDRRLRLLEGFMADDGDTKHIDFLLAPFGPIETVIYYAPMPSQPTKADRAEPHLDLISLRYRVAFVALIAFAATLVSWLLL